MKQLVWIIIFLPISVNILEKSYKWPLIDNVTFQAALMVIDEVTLTSNETLCKVTFSHTCDGTQECFTSINATNFIRVDKLTMYLKAIFGENENDRAFNGRQWSTVVDVEKLFKGINTNPFLNVFMKDMLDNKKFDFEPKLPFEPVKQL